jgi:hypothetical protein
LPRSVVFSRDKKAGEIDRALPFSKTRPQRHVTPGTAADAPFAPNLSLLAEL